MTDDPSTLQISLEGRLLVKAGLAPHRFFFSCKENEKAQMLLSEKKRQACLNVTLDTAPNRESA